MKRISLLGAVALVLALTVPAAPAAAEPSAAAVGPAVVNGTPTTVDAYPFIISQHRTGGSRPSEQSCTGTVVAPRAVLIAAHCKFAQGSKYLIYGRDDLADESTGTRIEIAEYRIHPNYDAPDGWRTGWDVAVIFTTTDIPVPDGMVYPDIARSGDALPLGTRGTAIGYGMTDSDDTDGNTRLYKTTLPTVDGRNCANINYQYDDRYMMCSGYGDGSTGLCRGDSGGPWLYDGKVYGVFSWLRTDCASYNAHGRLNGVMGDWARRQLGDDTPPPGGPAARIATSCSFSTPSCTFDGSASTGDVTAYRWDFGDGTGGDGATVEHTYPAGNGTYTTTLTVTDADGGSDSTQTTVQCWSFGGGQGFCFAQ